MADQAPDVLIMSIKTPPIHEVPKLTLHVPADRDYGFLLMQTKTVYGGLLADKQAKQVDDIVEKKQVYDVRCNMLAKKNPDKGLEFAVKAQDELMKLQENAMRELFAQQTDYQKKLNSMQEALETKWKNEKTIQLGVQVNVQPHK